MIITKKLGLIQSQIWKDVLTCESSKIPHKTCSSLSAIVVKAFFMVERNVNSER